MREIIKNIYIIEGIGNANVFLLGDKDGFVLVDTGIFKKTHRLIDQLKEQGFEPANLKQIILTHCHCDHIGGVTELVKCSDAKVAAHAEDIPYILQEKVIQGAYHGMMVEEQKVMRQFGCNIKKIDSALKDGDILDGLRVIQVPGHTPGSIALYEASRKIMFFGDVIRNNEKKGLTVGVPEKFNFDTDQTIADAVKLLEMPIDYALFSHGEPILKNTNVVLTALLMQIKNS